jgi:hypothetical protein
MYFHVVLARSLICTLRSPQVMNETQKRCPILPTSFISVHETQHLTPEVGVFQKTNFSHLWFVYRKLKSVTVRTSGLIARSFFLWSAPAVKGIWIRHGSISLTANIDPELPLLSIIVGTRHPPRPSPSDSTTKQRMFTAPWQPQSFAPEITGESTYLGTELQKLPNLVHGTLLDTNPMSQEKMSISLCCFQPPQVSRVLYNEAALLLDVREGHCPMFEWAYRPEFFGKWLHARLN